jgi:hypothetical protein
MIKELAVNLLASAMWTALVVGVGVMWYLARGRAREKAWIKEHGLMLLVYFRNVDWRCQKIHDLLMFKTEGEELVVSPALRYQLVKLQADLDALDRLAQVWARRLDHFPIWYPYALTIREFLEAQAELHVALCRHVSPLMHRLDGTTPTRPDPNDHDLAGYLGYFRGEHDRLWGSQPVPECGSAQSRSVLLKYRGVGLAGRLEGVFTSLQALLRMNRQLEVSETRIWRAEENPSDVWYRPSSRSLNNDSACRPE